MTRPRSASGQIASKTVCGRRHCRDCKRWRHVIDFGVRQWADSRRTIVRYHKPECMLCAARAERVRVSRLSAAQLEARRTQMRLRYRELRVDRGGWVRVGGALVEEISHTSCSGSGGAAYDPIPAHVALAWSEEEAAPAELRPGWWRADQLATAALQG